MKRREVLTGLAAAAVASQAQEATGKPALLGGTPVRTGSFPAWPVQDDTESQAMLKVLRSGKWGRGNGSQVAEFEAEYARLMG
ncbi:MAG: hypothetical protein WKF37_17085 [Bryobacteraceae bacterium]